MLSKTVLTLNRDANVLKSNLDNDSFTFSDLTRIEIIEEGVQIYKLRFHLDEGEKSSLFAFTKYTYAKEVADIIGADLPIKKDHS